MRNGTKEDNEAIEHALADEMAGRSWSCVCAGCVEYRKTCSPDLMGLHVAFKKLEDAEDRLDAYRASRAKVAE